jgi:predicted MFS family arabinose efflux permease
MKRPLSFGSRRAAALTGAATGLIAATYGLVRLAFGLYLPDVDRDLGLGAAAAGAVSSGASAVYCLGALVGFAVAPRRPRAVALAAGATAAAGAAGMASAPGATVFGAFAVLGSAGAGLASPAVVAVVQRAVCGPGARRAQTVANAGTGPGLVAAGVLALVLLPDWRTAWRVTSVVALGVAVLVTVLARPGRGGSPPAHVVPPRAWFTVHRVPLAAALLLGAGSAAVWTYGRSLLADSGTGEPVPTLAWIALGTGGAAVIGTARWTDRLRPRVLWAATAGVVAASSVGLVAAAGRPVPALVACLAFGWAYTAATGALIAWTTRLDAARAAAGTAALFVTLVLGQAVGAAGAGALAGARGYPAAFLAAAGVAGLAAVLGARTDRAGASGEGAGGDGAGGDGAGDPVRAAGRLRR